MLAQELKNSFFLVVSKRPKNKHSVGNDNLRSKEYIIKKHFFVCGKKKTKKKQVRLS